MDFQIPLEMLATQGIFAVLFCWLLFNSQKDSKDREVRLMLHLEKTTETLENLTNKMGNIEGKVDNIDNRLTVFENSK